MTIPPPSDPPGGGDGPGVVTHTLSYNIDQFEFSETQSVEDGRYPIPISEPNLSERYIFLGWYLDPELSQRYDFNSPITESFSLYGAVGKSTEDEKETFQVTFKSDGVIKGVLSFNSGDTCPYLPVEKEGYTFGGWFRTEQTDVPDFNAQYEFSTPLYSNITLFANWIKIENVKKITLTLMDLSGNSESCEINQGEHFTDLPESFGFTCSEGYYLAWYDRDNNKLDLNKDTFYIDQILIAKPLKDLSSNLWLDITLNFGKLYTDDDFTRHDEVLKGTTLDSLIEKQGSLKNYDVISWHINSLEGDVWEPGTKVETDVTLYAKLNSKAFPFYNPTLIEYEDDGLLLSFTDDSGKTYYLYYLGTAKDVILYEIYHVGKVLGGLTGVSESLTIGKETVESSQISQTISKTTGTAVTEVTESGSKKEALNIASDCLTVMGGVASFVPGVGTAVGGVATVLSGLFSYIADSSPSTTTTTKINLETWSETTGYSIAISNSIEKTHTLHTDFNTLVPDIDNYVSYFAYGTVEYFQVTTVDEFGYIESRLVTNVIESKEGWFSCTDGNYSTTPKTSDGDYIKILSKSKEDVIKDEVNFVNGLFKMEGSGTSSDPFIVNSAKQLRTLGISPYYCDAYFKLGDDVSASEYPSWVSIGRFNGELDGDGHTISNFKIKSASDIVVDKSLLIEVDSWNSSNYCYSGIFSKLTGYVHDLVIEDVNIDFETNTSSVCLVGTLAGFARNAIIDNIEVHSTVLNKTGTGGMFAGGLIGMLVDGCTVSDIIVKEDVNLIVKGNLTNVGGLFGGIHLAYKDGPVSIDSVVVYAKMSSVKTGANKNANVGVLFGALRGASSEYRVNISHAVILGSSESTSPDQKYSGILVGNNYYKSGKVLHVDKLVYSSSSQILSERESSNEGWRYHTYISEKNSDTITISSRFNVSSIDMHSQIVYKNNGWSIDESSNSHEFNSLQSDLRLKNGIGFYIDMS